MCVGPSRSRVLPTVAGVPRSTQKDASCMGRTELGRGSKAASRMDRSRDQVPRGWRTCPRPRLPVAAATRVLHVGSLPAFGSHQAAVNIVLQIAF